MSADITPHDILDGEGGKAVSWLASQWSKQDVIEEYDWLALAEDALHEIWMGCRWTTDEELADPDTLCLLFGDYYEYCDTSVVYWRAPTGAPGAHRYWTIEP